MKPVYVVMIMCLAASVLLAIHQMVCEQRSDTTSACDVALGVPMVVILAVACGIGGLAVLALSDGP
jgi:hypothetical protein